MPQVIRLTQSGASANIDMLVGDIYGGDCPSLGLRGDVIAASFGKAAMTRRETQRDGAREREREAQREVQRCGRTFGLRPPPRQVTMRREVKRSRGLMFLVRYLRALLRHYEEGFWLVVLAVVNSVPLLRLAAQRVGLVRLAESRAASMAMCGTLLVATAETLPDTAPDTVQRHTSETVQRHCLGTLLGARGPPLCEGLLARHFRDPSETLDTRLAGAAPSERTTSRSRCCGWCPTTSDTCPPSRRSRRGCDTSSSEAPSSLASPSSGSAAAHVALHRRLLRDRLLLHTRLSPAPLPPPQAPSSATTPSPSRPSPPPSASTLAAACSPSF